ncbi:MAG: dockerin type I repeat-containing protein [Ruminococcus sp.]|nr:dockerin type I repeat-containing protein [Ruminococcus sp.]
MVKKITAVILSILLVIALTTVAAFAADPPSKSPVIFIDTNATAWNNADQIYCHIYEYGGPEFYQWQTKKEKCSDEDGDGIWSYDLEEKEITLEDGKMYCVIFSTGEGSETYSLLMDKACYEDTVFISDEQVENPTNSLKRSFIASWKKSDDTIYGPVLMITSIGNVVGSVCPPGVTPQDIFKDFLTNDLDNARTYTEQSDQELIDHIIEDLPLTADQAVAAIEESGIEVEWEPSSPATPDQPTLTPTEPPTEEPTLPPSTGIIGDVDCDGVVTVLDAALIQKYKAHMIGEDRLDLSVADVDGDGVVTILDANRIQKFKAGLCDMDGYMTKSENAIYFDPASAGWKNFTSVGFHIVSSSGEDLTELGSSEEVAEKNPDGTYRLDRDAIATEITEGEQYIITFYNNKDDSTYDLVFDSSCFGDIARGTGKTVLDKAETVWREKDKTVCGPKLIISSTGTVLGSCMLNTQTPYTVLYDFFKDGYAEALPRSGKSSQALVDGIAQQIGIRYQYEINVAILESGRSVSWKPASCPLPVRG